MDDECVAELGRPISSMKVTELRDELTRRSLIKTGNKKELIDRLRTAIKRQSSQNAGATDLTIQSATHQLAQQEQPADLSQPEDDEEVDEEEPKHEAEHTGYNSSMAATVVQPMMNQQIADPIVVDQPQNLAIKTTQPSLNEPVYTEQPVRVQKRPSPSPPPSTVVQAQQPTLHASVPEVLSISASPEKSTREENVCEAAIDYSSQESTTQPEQVTSKSPAMLDSKQVDEVRDTTLESGEEPSVDVPQKQTATETRIEDHDADKAGEQSQSSSTLQSSLPTQNEPEKSRVHAPITLKRGATAEMRNSSESKEKRRKWSTKTESVQFSETASQANITSVGISSQKLQQLIEVRKSEQAVVEKVASEKFTPSGAKTDSSNQHAGKAVDPDSKKGKNEPDEGALNQESGDKIPSKAADNDRQVQKKAVNEQATNKNDKKVDAESVQESQDQGPEQKVDPTNILLVQNLVRPFTLSQLKEVLTKYGPMVEEKFWTDKVKSTCCVMFQNEEVAQQTRDALHGQQWPSSNPKTLKVTYIDEETLTKYINQSVTKSSESEAVEIPEDGEPAKGTSQQVSGKPITNRLGDTDATHGQSVKKRLGDKVSGEVSTKSSNINRASDNSHPQELDDLFKRTKSIPHLFWLPLSEEQAETRQKKRAEKEARDQELSRKAARHVSPPRWRSPARRSPVRHRSPARRSPPRRRSPARRSSPPRYRSPARRSPIGHRSPNRRRTPPTLTRSSPPRRRSPGPIRRSPGPIRRSPNRRSPMLIRRSSPPARRSPGLMRRSPGPIRRSPGPIRRSPGPIRRSPVHVRRSPAPIRGVSPLRRSRSRSGSSSRSRSSMRRRGSRTPPRRKSPISYSSDPRRAQRFDRIR